MSFSSDTLLQRLQELVLQEAAPSRFLLAFSGGLDSTVLLHALVAIRTHLAAPLLALHVNHGLHAQSDQWEAFCRDLAKSLDVEFYSRSVAVPQDSGLGLEAAARAARYAALLGWIEAGDCLLSAHHEEDQGETLLLNLLRGSGVDGLSGIGVRQTFGQGILLRPLLGVSVQALRDYARAQKLGWIEDPSNSDTAFDRNFLRSEIVPQLAARWPAVSARLSRSAELASEASAMLADLAAIDLLQCGTPSRIAIPALRAFAPARQRNLLRHAVRQCGLPVPPATRLNQTLRELLPARVDAQPLVRWPGAELRRYRDVLYVLPQLADLSPPGGQLLKADGQPFELGPQQGQLRLQPGAACGIGLSWVQQGLTVRYRSGGESIRPLRRSSSHTLRKLLQEAGVVPWLRSRIPLLYAGDELIAVADLWLAQEYAVEGGYAVCWDNKPALT